MMDSTMQKANRAQVFGAINSERAYQDARVAEAHDDPAEQGQKKLEQFALYMQDYLNEAIHQMSRTWGPWAYEQALHTIRKVTALGVAAMEVHGAPQRPGFERLSDEY